MGKKINLDPNEKYEALESAFFQLDDAVKELKQIPDAHAIADTLVSMMDDLQEIMEPMRVSFQKAHDEMIRDQERDYWRAVI